MKAKIYLALSLMGFLCVPVFAAPQLSLSPSSSRQTDTEQPQHLAEATMTAVIKAPINYLWRTLIDFPKYPAIFNRLQSVTITKEQDNLVYVESLLKPHFFVKTEVQHTINDLSGKPEVLKWKLLDGNFKHVHGEWYLKSLSATSTQVKYHLATDPGPIIPPPMVSFVLHLIQREIVSSLSQYAEKKLILQEALEAN